MNGNSDIPNHRDNSTNSNDLLMDVFNEMVLPGEMNEKYHQFIQPLMLSKSFVDKS